MPKYKHFCHQTLPVMTFVTGNFLLFQSQPSLILNSSQKDLAFLIIRDPVTSFPPKYTSVNHLHNAFYTCQSICICIKQTLLYIPLPPVSDGPHDTLISVKLHRIPAPYPHHIMCHVNSLYKFVKYYVQTEHTAVNLSFKCH